MKMEFQHIKLGIQWSFKISELNEWVKSGMSVIWWISMNKIDKVLDIVNENKEIVKNIAEPASKEVGGILGTFTGFLTM